MLQVFIGFVDSYGAVHCIVTKQQPDRPPDEISRHTGLFCYPGRDRFVFWTSGRLSWTEEPSSDGRNSVLNMLARRFGAEIKEEIWLHELAHT